MAVCYLCGAALPSIDSVRQQEHVVPEALYGAQPTKAEDRWKIWLWTHGACDRDRKSKDDHVVIQFHRAHAARGRRARKGDARTILKRTVPVSCSDQSPAIGILAAEMRRAPWKWVRGIHAALYGEFLPEQTWRVMIPPVPSFAKLDLKSVEEQLEREKFVADGIIDRLAAGIRTRSEDGVFAWGRKVRFQCVWSRDDQVKYPPWRCFWSIDYPGVLEWSEMMLPVPRPWLGMFRRDHPPTSATIITDEQIEAGRLFRQQLGNADKHPMPRSSLPVPAPRRRG